MERQNTILGPYRATKLWNDLITAFRVGLPLGRHRRYMKTYEDCFVSTDSVDWLHEHLNDHPEFGQVTRGQTIQLLQKFQKAKVFEDVRGGKYTKEEFDDNGKLYKFCQISPVKTKTNRTPLASRTNILDHHALEPIKMDLEKVKMKKTVSLECMPVHPTNPQPQVDAEEIWRTMTLEKLQKVLCLISMDEILDSQLVSAKHIKHNMTQLNKNGVVTNVPKEDQLPHWILSAMKVLANWPDQVEENLPQYPGFEKDIFTVITDYFISLKEPLLTFSMYEVFANVLVIAENVGRPKKRSHSSSSSNHGSSFGESVESLLLNLTLRAKNFVQTRRFSFDAACNADKKSDLSNHHCVRLDSDNSDYINYAPTTSISPRDYDNLQLHLRSNPYYQEESEGCYGNIQRLPSNRNSFRNGCRYASVQNLNSSPQSPRLSAEDQNSFGLRCYSTSNVNEVEPFQQGILEPGQRYDSEVNVVNGNANLLDHNYVRKEPQYGLAIALTNKPQLGATTQTNTLRTDHGQDGYSPRNAHSSTPPPPPPPRRLQYRTPPPPPFPPPRKKPPPYVPPPSYSTALRTSRPPSLSSMKQIDLSCSSSENTPRSDYDSIYYSAKSHLSYHGHKQQEMLDRCGSGQSSPRQSSVGSTLTLSGNMENGKGTLKNVDLSSGVYSPGTKARLNEALQLCLLLLPPGNKRKLYFLIRLMYKMCHNTQLHLEEGTSTKDLVLNTFSRCIFRSVEEADLDEMLVRHLVTVLIDNHMDIFKVPEALKLQIEERIAHQQKVQVDDSSSPLAYCQQVSMDTYESQKLSNSEVALCELLEDIIKNKTISSKDKRKKLKQFQKSHPDIYAQRFPTSQSEAELFPDKPKIKQPLLARPLFKFKNLRL